MQQQNTSLIEDAVGLNNQFKDLECLLNSEHKVIGPDELLVQKQVLKSLFVFNCIAVVCVLLQRNGCTSDDVSSVSTVLQNLPDSGSINTSPGSVDLVGSIDPIERYHPTPNLVQRPSGHFFNQNF